MYTYTQHIEIINYKMSCLMLFISLHTQMLQYSAGLIKNQYYRTQETNRLKGTKKSNSALLILAVP
jgi:hypothetical protein